MSSSNGRGAAGRGGATADGQRRILIIGAGPTGLGMGYRLRELGYRNFRIIEQAGHVGGLAHSFTDAQGFTWDIGGHVMFSHYAYYDRCFDAMMGDEFSLIERESWVRLLERWIPYPFQNNIRYLPPEVALECLAGLIDAQTGRGRIATPAQAANFGEFIDAVFGEGIARVFMRPYNFKVWAHSPEMMNKQWIGERVAVIDYKRALRNVVLGTADFGWGPNNRFKYPLRGGTGAFYDRIGATLRDHVTLNTGVRAIEFERKHVLLENGAVEPYDVLVSTMPLDVLITRGLRGDVPAPVRAAAGRLRHSSGHMVGLGIRRPCPSTKSWMYFPERNCPFYRVTYLSNYSPHMTPDRTRYYSLLCETSASEFKPVDRERIEEETIRGLENTGLLEPGERVDIVSRWNCFVDYSYPTPTVDRDEILATVIPWLEEREIYSRGRFGMWKYEVSNTDHTLMQGVELANRLVLHEPEHTIGMVYQVTDDGRKAAAHERPTVAGSGEKRIVPASRDGAGSENGAAGSAGSENGAAGSERERSDHDGRHETRPAIATARDGATSVGAPGPTSGTTDRGLPGETLASANGETLAAANGLPQAPPESTRIELKPDPAETGDQKVGPISKEEMGV